MAQASIPTEVAVEIVKGLVKGETQTSLSKRFGVHQTTVSKYRNKQDIKELIENEIGELMRRGLKQARRTVCSLSAKGTVKGAPIEERKLALDASKVILSHAQGAPGTVINTMIQINQAPSQQEELSVLSAFFEHTWNKKEIVDIDSREST